MSTGAPMVWTYSFRTDSSAPDHALDYLRHLFRTTSALPGARSEVIPPVTGFEIRWAGGADVAVVELRTHLTLDNLRRLMHDSTWHVMRQTLRACPLAENSLERDRSIE